MASIRIFNASALADGAKGRDTAPRKEMVNRSVWSLPDRVHVNSCTSSL
jgi:hypothetical protein